MGTDGCLVEGAPVTRSPLREDWCDGRRGQGDDFPSLTPFAPEVHQFGHEGVKGGLFGGMAQIVGNQNAPAP